MAKWHFIYQTLIVCLFLFSKVSHSFAQSDLDLYEVDDAYSRLNHLLDFQLMDESHSIEKREAKDAAANNTSSGLSYDDEKPAPPSKKVSIPLTPTISNVSIPYLKKNLGENGTGIRKDYSTTKSPPLIHSIAPTITPSSTNASSTTTANSTTNCNDDKGDFDKNIDGADIDDKCINQTLTENNATVVKPDKNHYYNTSIFDDPQLAHFYWVNMTNRTDVKVNDLLSQSHRRAATVKLSFTFPFYGHLITNVTIATGGFLYTGDYVHSWLAATQYIAPLMANFDTSITNDSFIKYLDNGTAFTVQWEKVNLQDKPEEEFSFQVTLFKNGDIVFVYENIPFPVDKIQDLHHPVKVGLSDAYIMEQVVFLVRRKTIYEYDRVYLDKSTIKNWTTIVLKAFPTCLDGTDCDSCLTMKTNLGCFWCPALGKCSAGVDRHRQNWVAHDCEKMNISNASLCSSVAYQTDDTDDDDRISRFEESPKALSGKILVRNAREDAGFSGILAILFLVGMVSGLSVWVFYAYRNPHTTSGQILIRYRPSQWRWKRGEARYTAATIHM